MAWLPDWLTGYDSANAAAADRADGIRANLDLAAYDAGTITAAEWQRRQDNGYGVSADSQRAEIDQTFAQSVKDNASAISQGINDTLSFSLGNILGAVPWWLWLAGAFGLFLYLGGGAVLRKQVARFA